MAEFVERNPKTMKGVRRGRVNWAEYRHLCGPTEQQVDTAIVVKPEEQRSLPMGSKRRRMCEIELEGIRQELPWSFPAGAATEDSLTLVRAAALDPVAPGAPMGALPLLHVEPRGSPAAQAAAAAAEATREGAPPRQADLRGARGQPQDEHSKAPSEKRRTVLVAAEAATAAMASSDRKLPPRRRAPSRLASVFHQAGDTTTSYDYKAISKRELATPTLTPGGAAAPAGDSYCWGLCQKDDRRLEAWIHTDHSDHSWSQCALPPGAMPATLLDLPEMEESAAALSSVTTAQDLEKAKAGGAQKSSSY
jgi:hypothetical protein